MVDFKLCIELSEQKKPSSYVLKELNVRGVVCIPLFPGFRHEVFGIITSFRYRWCFCFYIYV